MKAQLQLAAAAACLVLTGCQALEHLQTINDVANGDVDPAEMVGERITEGLEVGVAGLSPSRQYSSNGVVDLSLVSRGTEVSLNEISVEVKNRDGSYSDCEHDRGEVVEAASVNALTLLIDGSGSMERSYPDGECDTCPHDPGRERVGAAHRFIDTLYDVGPENRLAVAEFGPDSSLGLSATRLHSGFDDDRRRLWTALDSIGGHEAFGTPLYDSLFEMIEATSDEADLFTSQYAESVQRHVVVLSDGQDNLSDLTLNNAIVAAVSHNVAIYVVGLGPASAADTRFDDANNAIRDLQALAESTGGFYAGVDDPSRLHQLFDNVAYALAGGYERHTYRCLPGATASSIDRAPPSRGTRVEGRVVEISSNEVSSEWAFIAP